MRKDYWLKYGLLAAAMYVALALLLYFAKDDILLKFGSWGQYIIVIYCMLKVISLTKFDQGGFIKFRQAFKGAWMTFVLSATIIAIFNYILFNFIDPGLIEKMRAIQLDALERVGKTFLKEEELQQQIELIETVDFFDLKSLGSTLPLSFIMPGALISAIIALIKRREPLEPPINPVV